MSRLTITSRECPPRYFAYRTQKQVEVAADSFLQLRAEGAWCRSSQAFSEVRHHERTGASYRQAPQANCLLQDQGRQPWYGMHTSMTGPKLL